MHDLMGSDAERMPDRIKCLMLSCILSDTLEFRSPTTTDHDRAVAMKLAQGSGHLDPDYAEEMFAAKSDVSAFSDAELLRMDSKEYTLGGKELRISVLETTAPKVILDRKDSLMAAMGQVVAGGWRRSGAALRRRHPARGSDASGAERRVKAIAEKSFGAQVSGDTVVLPGVMSAQEADHPRCSLI
jgi:manganese-dependent inorganic pyrophosphatase